MSNLRKRRGISLVLLLAVSMLTITYLSSCKKQQYPLVVNQGLNITGFFEANPTQYSLFDQILEKTGYAGFLGAYGAYTVFAPNNTAVNLYLKGLGKTTVDQVDVTTLQNMVKLHVVQDTIQTGSFVDGKLRTPTMFGQYLTTGAVNISGTSSYIVNKQALIFQSNVILGNGIVQGIDHVLMPATLSIAQTIAASSRYTIFTQALQATGYYDTLNVVPANAINPAHKYFTVFAVSDSVLNLAGISSYAALQAKYSQGNPKSHSDSLYLYVAYHILAENSYLSDIISVTSHATFAPTEVITDVLQGQTILINNDTFNGILEPGAPVDRANSDITATNGVLHSTLKNIYIKVRTPARVDWDLADQPEFRVQTSIFRQAGKATIQYNSPGITDVVLNGGYVQYSCEASTTLNWYWWDDILNIYGFRNTASPQLNLVVFHTPTIIKGKYKVWFNWRASSTSAGAQYFFDGGDGNYQTLQNVITAFTINMPNSTDSGPVLESKGYKRYTTAPYGSKAYGVMVSVLLGTVNVLTTDRHYLKMSAIGGANSATLTADMIQFIPVDQDQEHPQFNRNGTFQ